MSEKQRGEKALVCSALADEIVTGVPELPFALDAGKNFHVEFIREGVRAGLFVDVAKLMA